VISFDKLSFLAIYSSAVVSAWLATYVVHSTLIIGGVALATRWRAPARAVQDVAWKLALTSGVLTATLALATGLRPLGGRYETAAVVEASWLMAPHASSLLRLLPMFIVALWLVYASCVLLKVGALTISARASLGPRVAADATTCELVAAVARTMDLTRRVHVTISDQLTSPVVLGASEITLPRRMLEEFTPEEQRSVIGHELAHLARRDPSWLMLAATIESLFFFQLMNRMARMHWQEQSEYICDEMATRAEGSRLALARSLARVATWSRGDVHTLLAPPAIAERPSTLLGRVQHLLDDDTGVTATSRRGFIVFKAALTLLVLVGSPAFAPGSVRGWGRPAFEWSEMLTPGQTIEVQGVMGSIHAFPTDENRVTVRATRHGRSTNPDVRFDVVRTEQGATICVLYATPPSVAPNRCTPGGRGQFNTPANDVEVEFAVHVPRGVGLIASSATGHITSGLLQGPVSASSNSGNIKVAIAAADWSGARDLQSLSGDVQISIPRQSDVAIAAETRTGTITSDFSIGQRHDSWWSRLKFRGSLGSSTSGVVGRGGRELRLSTITGNITILAN
jgi:beta-lactamase regulating signal transducer with metallopeptidase domain